MITTSSYCKKAQYRISDEYEGSAEQKPRQARRFRFLDWKDEVDKIISAKHGIDTGRISDWNYYQAWSGGESPEAAVDKFTAESRGEEAHCNYCDDPDPDFDDRAEIPNMCRDCWESEVESRNEQANPLADPEWRSDGF